MNTNNNVICVTGANGIIGRKIVKYLSANGFQVRALVRNNLNYEAPDVEVKRGDISLPETLLGFLENASILFHCAGEINNDKKMFSTNVEGVQNLISLAKNESPNLKFLHISSGGVVGTTKQNIVDENSPCNPQTIYEKSKWEAEMALLDSQLSQNLIILRPINVIDFEKPGVATFALSSNLKSKLKLIIFGNEFAHAIHSQTVAEAAIFLAIEGKNIKSGVYFVSNDHDEKNTNKEIWRLLHPLSSNFLSRFCLPAKWARYIRKLTGGNSTVGTKKFSSKKLSETGFNRFMTINESIKLLRDP